MAHTCSKHRAHWKLRTHPAVEFFQVADPASGATETRRDSYALVAGEGNFLRQQFRYCKVNPNRRTFCGPGETPPGPSSAE